MGDKELNSVIDRAEDEYQKLKDKVMEQGLEIERLKIIEEKYKDSQLYIHDFKEEIERLNNIINEFEKYLEDRYYGRGKYYMDTYSIGIKDILDKLQELKGDE